jgi:hypothetical protein
MSDETASLPHQPKDSWDKINIFFSALTPIAIFVAGLFISQATQSLEHQRAEERDRHDALISESQLRIGQADLAVKLLEPLASTDLKKRNMAREIMLSPVIPDGPRILAAIAEPPPTSGTTPSAETKETVSALDARRQELIRFFFSPDRGDRVRAYRAIQTQWQDDSALLAALLTEANRRWKDANSILTTTSLTLRFSDAALTEHRKEIEDFLSRIPKNADWKETLGYAERVRDRLTHLPPSA